MKKVAIDDVPVANGRSASVTRNLAAELDTNEMGIQYYELEPGEYISRTYHMHEDQEEVFVTLEGTATFETEEGEINVHEDELVRFARGEYQRGRNGHDGRTVVLGLGAPNDPAYENAERLRYCKECEEMTAQTNADRPTGVATVCDVCGSETGRWE
jgi:mannose-6-phosphate isomerase-like protein (cupin superfamily)